MNDINFIGDVVLNGISVSGSKKLNISRKVSNLLLGSYTIANLESPITEKLDLFINKKQIHSSPQKVSILKDLGVNAVCLANNHMWDYGDDGFIDTLSHLKQNGIDYFGAGYNIEEATKPLRVGKYEIFGASLGPYEFGEGEKVDGSPDATEDSIGISHLTKKHIEKMLSHSKTDNKILICHWGPEAEYHPHYKVRALAKKLNNYGFRKIIGIGPHCIQPVEYFSDGFVVYSLGDFLFRPYFADSRNRMVENKTDVIKHLHRGFKGRISLIFSLNSSRHYNLSFDWNNRINHIAFSNFFYNTLNLTFKFRTYFNYRRYYIIKTRYENLFKWCWSLVLKIKHRRISSFNLRSLIKSMVEEVRKPKKCGVPDNWE